MSQSRKMIHIGLWTVLIAVVVAGLSLSRRADQAQSGQRDLSKPSSRMVGHWQFHSISGRPHGEWYFGEVGDDGYGSLVIIDPAGLTLDHRYTIVSEKKLGTRMRIRHFLSPTKSRTEDIAVSKSGLNAQHTQVHFEELLTRKLTYIDDKVRPD